MDDVRNTYRIAEDQFVAATARWQAARRAEENALEDLAAQAVKFREQGASLRTIGAKSGISHAQIKRMTDDPKDLDSKKKTKGKATKQTRVQTITANQLLDYYLPVFGEPTRAMVCFNDGDVLLKSGQHPKVFAEGGSSEISVPNLLLFNSSGEMLGIEDCNCGYGGTGPNNTIWLLERLDWPADQRHLVYDNRFLDLRRDGQVEQSRYPVSHIDYRMMSVHRDGGIRVKTDSARRPGPGGVGLADIGKPRTETFAYKVNGQGNTPEDWIDEVFNSEPIYPWASGPRVARCYLNRDVIRAAGLAFDNSNFLLRGPRYVTVILEQGDTQLWCQTSIPLEWTEFISKETYDLLAHADLYPDDLKDMEPHTWFQKLLARRTQRPPFIDISRDGNSHLRREPIITEPDS